MAENDDGFASCDEGEMGTKLDESSRTGDPFKDFDLDL